MEKEKIIQVKDLGVTFDGNPVLKDVTFDVYKGEVTVILGASGCGKSTVLRHLLGLYPLLKGEINIMGRNYRNITEKQQLELYLQMGVFYQNGALLNSLTLGENISLPLRQHTDLPNSVIDDIVMMKLSLVNLESSVHLYPSELSGGMLKRAALARAIIMDPPLLFCDEPGAGLDPISLEALDTLIINLRELLGITVIMVTHEVSSIMRIADRIIYLEKGHTLFQGTLKQALKQDIKQINQFFSVIEDADKLKG